MSASDQRCTSKKVLRMQVAHIVVGIVDHKLCSPGLRRTCDDCIYLIGEQSPPLFIFGIALDYLLPGDNAACTFKICREKKFHCMCSSQIGHPLSQPLLVSIMALAPLNA